VLKLQGVKYQAGNRHGGHYMGVSPGDTVPVNGPATWVAKPLGSSRGLPKAWVICPEMVGGWGGEANPWGLSPGGGALLSWPSPEYGPAHCGQS
jgi:hypothetical protein